MAVITRPSEVPAGFKPNPKQANFIRALIWCFSESQFGSVNEWFPDIEWSLVNRTVSAADTRTEELIAAGYIQQTDWHDMGTTICLSDAGVVWAMERLGMPDPSDLQALMDFAVDVEFERKPEPRQGSKPTVKNTTTFVAQERYTRAEAAAAIQAVEAAYNTKKISERSAAGYKAHITRRTVSA